MQRSLAALFLCLILSLSAFSEESGTIRCNAGSAGHVPAWAAPGSPHVVEQLNCGQPVTIIGLERGYAKVQIGKRVAYVKTKDIEMQSGAEAASESMIPGFHSPGKTKSTLDRARRHQAGLGFEISNIYYDEPELMRNKGFMYGVSGDYTFRPNHFAFKLESRFSLGDVDYWSNGTGVSSGLRDYNFETRFSVGYDIPAPSRKAVFTPFIGFGHRYLFDGESGVRTSAGFIDYDRKQHYLYSPIGLETMIQAGANWKLGLAGEYDLFWHGWNHSEINEVGSPAPIKFDQKDGWGTRGSIKFIRKLGKTELAAEPYFRYWNVEDSDRMYAMDVVYFYGSTLYIGMPAVEPHNTTTEWGLKLGVRF